MTKHCIMFWYRTYNMKSQSITILLYNIKSQSFYIIKYFKVKTLNTQGFPQFLKEFFIFVFLLPLHVLRLCSPVSKAKTLSQSPCCLAALPFRFIGHSLHQNQTNCLVYISECQQSCNHRNV